MSLPDFPIFFFATDPLSLIVYHIYAFVSYLLRHSFLKPA
jgi:hypothetical protein